MKDYVCSGQWPFGCVIIVAVAYEREVVVGKGGDCGFLYVGEVLLGFKEEFIAVLPEDDCIIGTH